MPFYRPNNLHAWPYLFKGELSSALAALEQQQQQPQQQGAALMFIRLGACFC